MGTLVNENTRSQCQAIRKHLEEHGWIDRDTSRAICDCDRISARIWDLKNDPVNPMNIETVMKTKKNRFGHTTRYAEYRLVREETA
jgi:hypothetical protein